MIYETSLKKAKHSANRRGSKNVTMLEVYYNMDPYIFFDNARSRYPYLHYFGMIFAYKRSIC